MSQEINVGAQVAQEQLTIAPVAAQQTRAQSPAIKFRMLQGFRPQAGGLLYAHSAAFIKLTGMREGRRVSAEFFKLVMGPVAYRHHVDANNPRWTGFMVQTDKGVELTEGGKMNTHWINANPEHVAAFIDILSTGSTDRAIPPATPSPYQPRESRASCDEAAP